jgi:DNA-directed RNA polymerase specialized sigma24 family protein
MNTEPTSVSESNSPAASHLTDPVFLEELRAQMLKFVRLQLPDEALAEDAVQEALEDSGDGAPGTSDTTG